LLPLSSIGTENCGPLVENWTFSIILKTYVQNQIST